MAILARNNVSFRKLSEPVEVTHLYNKPTAGKNHLDLPNIHVYEVPDTNLQVMVNAGENKKDIKDSIKNYFINQPPVIDLNCPKEVYKSNTSDTQQISFTAREKA